MKAYAWGFVLLVAAPLWAQGATSASPASAPPVAAAEVVLLSGHGSALGSNGQARRLKRGDTLYAGDTINSGADGYLNMHFRDGGYVLLRPNTRFQIEAYQYQPAPVAPAAPAAPSAAPAPAASAAQPASSPAPAASGSRAFFRLLRGGFRAVSGLIGHRENDEFHITTPVATMGIRGTDYLVVLPNEGEAAQLDAQAGDKLGAKGGVVVGVIRGGIFMKNANGKLMDVVAGQYAMTRTDGSQILLPFEPGFLKLLPIPDPTTACQ